jgi:glyoxylase-like metal-dependent hydrolase (beta-lactamase superfamily II)
VESREHISIKTFAVGHLRCNCTIIADDRTKEAIVIDPGGDADKILSYLASHGLRIKEILHTHAHFDHFMAAGTLKQHSGARISLHPGDRMLWDHLEEQCRMFGVPYAPVPPPDHEISHEEEFCVGSCVGQALHTPGHSPGSTSFLFAAQKTLIAGDTLFRGSIGRTDLWGGDFSQIDHSIREILYILDEDTKVVTGHGPDTSIGHEVRNNAVIRG